jgi:hypothetical protein
MATRPDRQVRPGGGTAARSECGADNKLIPRIPLATEVSGHLGHLVAHVDQVRKRAIQEALADGFAATYERRARLLEWARPRPSDYPGRCSEAELAERDRNLATAAALCRHRATLGLSTGDLELLDVVLDEVAR